MSSSGPRHFDFEHLRRSFLLSHGALRTLIGSYLEISPEKAQFIQGSHGKPKLVGGGGTAVPLEFNMSHSGNVVLLAFSSTCELGVDVELIRPLEDMAGIADRFFSREESEELFSLAPEERERAFYLCWTRKEAYVKAVGEGLSIPLDSFRVTLRPGDPARFLHLNHDASLAQNWTLHNLELGDGELSTAYAAALAYCDAPRPVHVQPVLEMEDLLNLR